MLCEMLSVFRQAQPDLRSLCETLSVFRQAQPDLRSLTYARLGAEDAVPPRKP